MGNEIIPSKHAFSDTDPETLALIKQTVCKGATDTELAFFLYNAKRAGLDPLRRQIHAVRRKNRNPDGSWGETMTIQTGIDGYRLIAARSGRYAPGADVVYGPDLPDGHPSWARATVKLLAGGAWHDVSATAHWSEYAATYFKDGKQALSPMWQKMPRLMLGKCAEALALRKAFPDELSGIYTDEEMAQAPREGAVAVIGDVAPEKTIDMPPAPKPAPVAPPPEVDPQGAEPEEAAFLANIVKQAATPPKAAPSACISDAQRKLLFALLWAGSKKSAAEKDALSEGLHQAMFTECGCEHTEKIPRATFNKLLAALPKINPACQSRVAELLAEKRQ